MLILVIALAQCFKGGSLAHKNQQKAIELSVWGSRFNIRMDDDYQCMKCVANKIFNSLLAIGFGRDTNKLKVFISSVILILKGSLKDCIESA